MKVLLVEDNELLRTPLVSVLERMGCEVLCFDNAEAANAALADHTDLAAIVSDFRLPGTMSGLDLLRAHGEKARVRVLISGFAKDVDPGTLVAEGITFMQKPFSMKDLIAAVTSAG